MVLHVLLCALLLLYVRLLLHTLLLLRGPFQLAGKNLLRSERRRQACAGRIGSFKRHL